MLSIDDNITNYRGNEIIRTLTVFTVIFIPVTAFGVVWGMNFKHMHELEWQWGYGFHWLLILLKHNPCLLLREIPNDWQFEKLALISLIH